MINVGQDPREGIFLLQGWLLAIVALKHHTFMNYLHMYFTKFPDPHSAWEADPIRNICIRMKNRQWVADITHSKIFFPSSKFSPHSPAIRSVKNLTDKKFCLLGKIFITNYTSDWTAFSHQGVSIVGYK